MKVKCNECKKKIDIFLIDKDKGAYYNHLKQFVCYDCLLKELKERK